MPKLKCYLRMYNKWGLLDNIWICAAINYLGSIHYLCRGGLTYAALQTFMPPPLNVSASCPHPLASYKNLFDPHPFHTYLHVTLYIFNPQLKQ